MICKKNKDNTMVVQLCTFWMGHLELILSKLKDCNVDWVKVNRKKKKWVGEKFGKKVTLAEGQLQANLQHEKVKT
jgi:hypothetical protein